MSKEYQCVDVVCSSTEFHARARRVLELLRPLEHELSVLEAVPVMQYVTGMMMARASIVFPEHPVHPHLTALAEGYCKGVELYQHLDNTEDGADAPAAR